MFRFQLFKLQLIFVLFLLLAFPFYSQSEDIKLYEWGFNVDGFHASTDIHESIISPTSEYILLINKVLIPVSQYIDSLIYIVDLRGYVLNRFIVKDYVHSVEISPSGEYIVIGTMNDIPQGNPTKGKIYCYDKKGNKKWEKDIWGKPYLSKNGIAINVYQKQMLDPVTEERYYRPAGIKIFNYEGKEIFQTKKATKLVSISQDGNYLVTSSKGKTSLNHISGKLVWTKDIGGYVSLSKDNSIVCIGERKVDKKDTVKGQRIQCFTKEGKTIWADKEKTRYGLKIAQSIDGDYLVAYPSGIEYAGEGEAYFSDKKEVIVYNRSGQKLWTFKEPVKNMGSFKQVLISKNGSVAILSEEFLIVKAWVEKNDWVYFFNSKGEMLLKTNKIGGSISLSDDGKYLVTGPYFYDTQN